MHLVMQRQKLIMTYRALTQARTQHTTLIYADNLSMHLVLQLEKLISIKLIMTYEART